MRTTLRPFRMIALVMTLCVAAAVSSAAQTSEHDHGTATAPAPQRGMAGMPRMSGTPTDVMEQIAALDARIKMLSADMHMFSGELKVDVMASLLTAMIERQSLMEGEMRTMREGMMRRMMMEHSATPATPGEVEPGAMCAPAK